MPKCPNCGSNALVQGNNISYFWCLNCKREYKLKTWRINNEITGDKDSI